MKAHEITSAIAHYCPEAKNCAWSEIDGMGYFRCDLDGKRRVITVELTGWHHMLGVPIPAEEKSFGEVLGEIIRELKK